MEIIWEDIERREESNKENTAIGKLISFLTNKIERCEEMNMPMEKWAFQQTLKEVRKLVPIEGNQIVSAYNVGKREQGCGEKYLSKNFNINLEI